MTTISMAAMEMTRYMENGGDGDDVLNGDAGNDALYGKEGDDTLSGGEGDDSLDGDVGNDVIYGDGGLDYLYGRDGNDTLNGGDGDDYLYAHEGNDILNGGDGVDRLFGGDGDDILNGGAGGDQYYGGLGADTHVFTDMSQYDGRLEDTISGFSVAQGDKLDISDLLSNYDAATDDINDFLTLYGGARTLIFVDQDGAGTEFKDTKAIRLYGVNFTNDDLPDLINDGTLIV